jgi:hypothetical protein
VYPPILYFCKIAAVNVQQRHLTVVLDPVQQQKMGSMLSGEFDQFARLEIQLSLSPKATAERNFERVTLANLAGVEKAVIWLDQEGQVFHVDAFLYDLFWFRTGTDQKQQVLQKLYRSEDHLDRAEVVDTLPLSKDVRVYAITDVHWGDVPRDRSMRPVQAIPLEDFPGDSWEVPTSTWIQLDGQQKEVKCVIVLPVWE